jgi:glycosyltransferase involved in cell wall biosynthesis
MKVVFFANKMPDLCGAFLHDIDLAIELQKRGHQAMFLTITIPKEGYNGGTYRGFRFMHYSAGSSFLDSSEVWICPHSPCLPDVRKLNARGYNRPIVATCHYDGNYLAITKNGGRSWVEMLFFINGIMEANYRKNIAPWPSQITQTRVIRPIMHRDKIVIDGDFSGDCITLVNANQNKGVSQFIDIAKKMPTRKFLGILPYYGERQLPPAPSNIEWIPFDDDIRNILKRTRILLVPSFYESFGRIAVEAMVNGIPVLYSKIAKVSPHPGGSTEGLHEWIQPAGIACDRDNIAEWCDAIASLDDEEVYADRSQQSIDHIDDIKLFTEATTIAEGVELFARQNPVVVRATTQQEALPQQRQDPGRFVQPLNAKVGFANGRLRIQR